MNQPRQRFTGIFVPVEILELEGITLFEERLLAIIDSLYDPEYGGCHASNDYLAQKMRNAKPNTVVKALVKLRSMGLIEDVSFNGRKRVMRACIGKVMERGQSQSACDLNHSLHGRKITPCMGEKSHPSTPSPYYMIRKEERKEDKNIAQTAARSSPCARSADPPPRPNRTCEIKFSFDTFTFENISEQDMQSWQALYTSIEVKRELMEMIEWIKSNPSKAKAKKLWRKFILGWLQRSNEKSSNRSAYQSSRQKADISRHQGLQNDHRPRNPSKVKDYSQWKPDGEKPSNDSA